MIVQNLVLGTANFGENYGIANSSGLSAEEVEKILIWSTGKIPELDTSLDYQGSHHAISKHSAKFKITSKINLDQVKSPKDIPRDVDKVFEELATDKIERMLLRPRSNDGQFTIESMVELEKFKSTGVVTEIGLSIYETNELDFFVNSLESPIVFQVPLNLLNRAFHDKLDSQESLYKNFKFYVRSIFLQGLLLLNPRNIPSHLKEVIAPIDLMNEELSRIGKSTIEATFAFIQQQNWVNGVIMGINSLRDLKYNYEIFERKNDTDLSFLQKLPVVPSRILDPRKW